MAECLNVLSDIQYGLIVVQPEIVKKECTAFDYYIIQIY